jgi:sugar O-acyltransferase (sialic acid O-acetyltransferase NeuD family)
MSGGSGRSQRGPAPLLVFPANGNALEALDCLGGAFSLLAFVDDTLAKQASGLAGHRVGGRALLDEHREALVLAVPGGPASFKQRAAVITGLGVAEGRFARVVHPTARVSPLARMGHNLLLMAGVVITSNAVIGDHVCILPNTVVHHDALIGDYTLVGSGVGVAGSVRIGRNCYIGSGSTLMNGVEIGDGALVGLGSTVIRDVPPGAVVAGNPARVLRQG